MQSNIIDFTEYRTPRPPLTPLAFPKPRKTSTGASLYLRMDDDDPSHENHSVRALVAIGGAAEIGASAPIEYCEKYLESLCRTASASAGHPSCLMDFVAVIEGTEEGGWFVSIIWQIPNWITDDRLLATIATLKAEYNFGICCLETCSPTEVHHLLGRLGVIHF